MSLHSNQHTITRQDFYSDKYYQGIFPEPRFKKVEAIFNNLNGDRLLDVGCGDGDITLLLKRCMAAKDAYGVELSDVAVQNALKRGIMAYQLDLDNADLPFTDCFFDTIYCGEIIEHVFNPTHLLKEVFRTLNKNGVCVLTTPNLAGWSNRFALLFGYQPYAMSASPENEGAGKMFVTNPQGQWGHIRVLTLKALLELVSLQGFTVKNIIGCPVTIQNDHVTPFLKTVTSIDRFMSFFPAFATRIILVLTK